jgi:NAD(P)-dependent dehydrogenase (short-subunit alcohol dehydrogenase family)
MTRLAGKVAIVTGGAGGIGQAAGALFAAEGAHVLLVDLDEKSLQQAVVAIDSAHISYTVADVTQPNQVEHYVRTAVERYGGIDVFLNNAGIEGEVKLIPEYSLETFDKVMAVNVRGAWLGLKYVIPEMHKRGGGSIIITSSIAGITGMPGVSAYVMSKHAVVGMMRSAARECAPLNIRVNTINPGMTETRMMRSLEQQSRPDAPEEAKRNTLSGIPLQRYADPKEIARLMLFLASDESSYCTGSVYMVDGGVTMY